VTFLCLFARLIKTVIFSWNQKRIDGQAALSPKFETSRSSVGRRAVRSFRQFTRFARSELVDFLRRRNTLFASYLRMEQRTLQKVTRSDGVILIGTSSLRHKPANECSTDVCEPFDWVAYLNDKLFVENMLADRVTAVVVMM
jgi:hypothetical protein